MTDQPLSGRRILTFVGDIYEDLELWYPKLRLIEAGAEVVVAGEKARHRYEGKNGYPCVSDAPIAEMNSADFAGVVVPGGFMPDNLIIFSNPDNRIRISSQFAFGGTLTMLSIPPFITSDPPATAFWNASRPLFTSDALSLATSWMR